jgi:hypothetical protein
MFARLRVPSVRGGWHHERSFPDLPRVLALRFGIARGFSLAYRKVWTPQV